MSEKPKRIIIQFDTIGWNEIVRKEVMRILIHMLDDKDFDGVIIEPIKPYPLIHITKGREFDKVVKIKW